MGFTPDSTRFIVERNRSFWFINLADLTQQPYMTGTMGTSGVNEYGIERWSPNGHLYLSFGCLGCQQIVAVSPSDGTEDMLLNNIGRHGAQFNWSADGKEIAYVEGDYLKSMRARVINLQTRQSRTLTESQFPMTLTGASCSPDGKWIAVREQTIDSPDTVLWLVDPKTGSKTRFTYNLSGVEVYGGWQDMVWSSDGSKLALRGYSTEARGFAVIEVPTGKVIYQGTEQTRGSPLAWSADGKSLLVLDFLSDSNTGKDFHLLRWVSIR